MNDVEREYLEVLNECYQDVKKAHERFLEFRNHRDWSEFNDEFTQTIILAGVDLRRAELCLRQCIQSIEEK